MFFIYGRQKARIKKYTSHEDHCKSCKAFDIGVEVYLEYYHLYYIPVCPVGPKTATARCNSCGEPVRQTIALEEYAAKGGTPFYLFSLPILLVGLVLLIIYSNHSTQKEKEKFVADPKVGDVYTIRNDKTSLTTYYFLKITGIQGDTILAYHNSLEYYGHVSRFNEKDYFVKDEEMYFMKAELQKMLERGEINDVSRDHSDYQGFERERERPNY